MPPLPPILVAGLTGFISGLLLSIPVGPINLTILNEGARRGFKWALLIGLGASAMEVIYCAIAFTGFSSFFGGRMVKASMEVFSFAFMLFIGVKFLLARSGATPLQLGSAANRLEARLGERLQPTSAFMTGLVRVMGNLGVLLFWIVLAASFMSRDWVRPEMSGKLACGAGVALGTGLWVTGLSWAASRGRGRFSEQTLVRMERGSGVLLVGLGLANGIHIAWQLANHKL